MSDGDALGPKTNYVLIDYENVQPAPEDILRLRKGPFKVLIFLGPQQTKISRDLAEVMQEFGTAAEYVAVEVAGKNAVDFHIAFQLGRISAQYPDAFFHVISKDGDLDLLAPHLKKQKILMLREVAITEIPLIRVLEAKTPTARADVVIQKLQTSTKPATVAKLKNAVNSLFGKQLDEDQLDQVLARLQSLKFVELIGAKVTYPS